MDPLTKKQQAMLDFIKLFIAEKHFPPTYEEIRVGLGLGSKNTVDYHLTRLEAAGYIARKRYSPRAIWLVAHE